MSPVYFMFFAAVGALVPYLSVYYKSIGLTATEIGMLQAVQPILIIIAQPIFGPMTDRSDHRGRMLGRILLATGLTCLLLILGRTFWSLVPLVALWSLFAGLISPVADSIALGETARTGVAYPRLRLWGSIGFLLVTMLMGRLYNTIDLRWGFVAYAALMGVSWYLAVRLPREQARVRRPDWHTVWRLFTNRYLLVFLGVSGILQFTLAANSAFFSVHVTGVGGSAAMLGAAWGLAALVEVPAWMVLGRMQQRFGTAPLLTFAAVVYALRWWAYSAAATPGLLVGLAVLQAFSFAVFMPTAVVFVGELTPPELRTTGQALLGLVNGGIATVLGSLVGGAIVDRVGTAGLYRALTWIALVAAAGFLVMTRLPHPDKEVAHDG